MEPRSQFTFYESFRASTRRIKKAADRALAYDVLCDYALYGTEPDIDKLPDSVAVLFLNAKPNLDASKRKATSGKKGGESKQTGSKPEANRKQTGSEKEKEKEKEKEIENECYKGGAAESKPKADLSLFTSFWAAYPTARGGGRENAFEEWKNLAPDDATAKQIMDALEIFKKSRSWTEYDGKYIPSAVNFLKQRQWEKPPVISPQFQGNTLPKGASGNLGKAELEAIQKVLLEDIPNIPDNEEEEYGT